MHASSSVVNYSGEMVMVMSKQKFTFQKMKGKNHNTLRNCGKKCARQNPHTHRSYTCSVWVCCECKFFVKLVFTNFKRLKFSDFTIKLQTVAAGIDQLDCLNNTLNVLWEEKTPSTSIKLRCAKLIRLCDFSLISLSEAATFFRQQKSLALINKQTVQHLLRLFQMKRTSPTRKAHLFK